MGVSSRALVTASLIAVSLTACDILLGLDQYRNVDCANDCLDAAPHADAGDAGRDAGSVEDASDASVTPDARLDASEAQADVGFDAPPPPEGGYPVPPGHQIWAHWRMPNPDASAGTPDSSALLPNPMGYDAGADGGSQVAYDLVTGLSWWREGAAASSLADAWGYCAGRGPGWRVPTRIELISLVDFTRQPAIDLEVFTDTGTLTEPYWSTSAVAGQDGTYWTVSFVDGLASTSAPGAAVRCVSGGVDGG
jgi:hypothetical protein